MNELKLTIENVSPVVMWGSNNEYFEIIRKHFPKIKIVARGNEVKVLGDESELNLFNLKFQSIMNHVDKFQSLNNSDLETILGTTISVPGPGENLIAKNGGGGDPIVFGPNGIVVKDAQRGGHFAAMEQPEVLAHEIREFFRPLRTAAESVTAR